MTQTLLGRDILLVDNDLQIGTNQDFAVISGMNNLRQAIFNRLKTNLGEYYIEEYGSELYKCIGKPTNELLLTRIQGFIFEALLQEPRISTIDELNVQFNRDNPNTISIDVDIVITPIQQQEPLNLIFPDFVLD